MSSGIADLVLDADVLMNLLATDRLAEMLAANEVRGLVCPKTRAEAIYLNPRVSGEPRDVIDLAPDLASGVLIVTVLTGDEIASFVRFAIEVDDGEAQVLAVGLHRRLTVATDDRRARGLAARLGLAARTTPDLVLEWARRGGRNADEQRQAFVDIETRARFRPKPTDANWQEWRRLRNG
jgi:predicted nucleic acid-binding protein